MSTEIGSGPEADKLEQLETLLAREQEPSPLARARFLAALEQETLRQPPAPANGLTGFFRLLWPARPAWGVGYSAALLTLGLLTGQLLPPRSLGVGPQVRGAEYGQVQLCAVPPPVECVAGQGKC